MSDSSAKQGSVAIVAKVSIRGARMASSCSEIVQEAKKSLTLAPISTRNSLRLRWGPTLTPQPVYQLVSLHVKQKPMLDIHKLGYEYHRPIIQGLEAAVDADCFIGIL